jgi:prepilin-type N-terminal cleavage/methylation domain-containing protein
MKIKQKGFTLIEVLLSLSLMLLLVSACVFNFNTLLNNQVRIENKVSGYLTLNRFAQCSAELMGKKSKIMIDQHKVKVVMETYQGETSNIPTLESQIEELNSDALFDGNETNVITYNPDGSLEKGGKVNVSIENGDETNVAHIAITEWNTVSVVYGPVTNDVECDEDVIPNPW